MCHPPGQSLGTLRGAVEAERMAWEVYLGRLATDGHDVGALSLARTHTLPCSSGQADSTAIFALAQSLGVTLRVVSAPDGLAVQESLFGHGPATHTLVHTGVFPAGHYEACQDARVAHWDPLPMVAMAIASSAAVPERPCSPMAVADPCPSPPRARLQPQREDFRSDERYFRALSEWQQAHPSQVGCCCVSSPLFRWDGSHTTRPRRALHRGHDGGLDCAPFWLPRRRLTMGPKTTRLRLAHCDDAASLWSRTKSGGLVLFPMALVC